MAEPKPLAIVHVIRPLPPWRRPEYALTECGLLPSEHEAITRDEFSQRLDEWGQQRTAMHTCMTCMTTFARYGGDGERAATWERNPVAALAREAEKARWAPRHGQKHERLDVELRAIMQIIAEHRDEFDAIIARLEWGAQARPTKGAVKRG